MAVLSALKAKEFDFGKLFNLESCRQEIGKHEVFVRHQGKQSIVIDDFVPVRFSDGEEYLIEKSTSRVESSFKEKEMQKLGVKEPENFIAFALPCFNRDQEELYSIFPCLLEKALAKKFGSYQNLLQ